MPPTFFDPIRRFYKPQQLATAPISICHARSSFYAMKSRQQATAWFEADLEASPWEGEGHRKVWARLRVCRGICVSRKRVLRVMRENNLLLLPPPWRKSPCR